MNESLRVSVSYYTESGSPLALPETSLTVPVVGHKIVDGNGDFHEIVEVWESHLKAQSSEMAGVYAVVRPLTDQKVPDWLFRKVRGEEPSGEYVYMS